MKDDYVSKSKSYLADAGALHDYGFDVARVLQRIAVVVARLDHAAADDGRPALADEDVAALNHPPGGAGIANGHRLLDVLEVIPLDHAAGIGLAGHADVGVAEVVIVEDVHRLAEAHARVPLRRVVEPVVMIAHLQMPDVLRPVGVGVAEQHVLDVVVRVVPRNRDVIGAALDVYQPVEGVGEIAMVYPDVMGEHLNVDRVVGQAGEDQVPDDDVADDAARRRRGRFADRVADVEASARDPRVGAAADDGLVRRHVAHRPQQRNHPLDDENQGDAYR